MASVQCLKISKLFGGVAALADVSLTFEDSGIVAIVGPNGAGKTTLIDILSGFAASSEGQCFVNGVCTDGRQPYELVRLGLVRTFQALRLVDEMSVLDHVLASRPVRLGEAFKRSMFQARYTDDADMVKAMEILNLVGLAGLEQQRAGGLSYGQRKLLTIANCLGTNPNILLLDEPVAGVQPGLVEEVSRTLSLLRAERKMIIFVEHDIQFVRDLADRVVVMSAGRVVADGDPVEVFARPEVLQAFSG